MLQNFITMRKKGPVRGHSLAHAWNLMTGGTRDVHNRVPSPQKPLENV